MRSTHPTHSTRVRPRVLAVLPGFFPSTTLTVVKPLLGLHHAQHIIADITLESWVSARQIERADVVILSRNLEPLYGHILDTAVALGKPVIYDIDDDLFALPAYYQPQLAAVAQTWQAQLERYLTAASLVRVYAAPLHKRVLQLNRNVKRVDGPIDWSLVPDRPLPRDLGGDFAQIKIVYATSRWMKDDLAALFLPAMEQLLATYSGQVQFFCWGYHPPQLERHPAVQFLDFVHNYDRFFRRFARSGFDIGLAPLRDEAFYRSKSNNKFREYAACRIAGIYSDVDVYANCVEDGRTGLLVPNTTDAWFAALSGLVENAALRRTIQTQAFQHTREHYSLEKTQAEWLDHIHMVSTPPPVSVRSHQDLPTVHKWQNLQQNLQQPPADSSLIPTASVVHQARYQLRRLPQRGLQFGRRSFQLIHSIRTHGIQASWQRLYKSLHDVWTVLSIKWALSPSSTNHNQGNMFSFVKAFLSQFVQFAHRLEVAPLSKSLGLGLVVLLSLLSLSVSPSVFKIALTDSGVYRVTYADLAAAGLDGSQLVSAGLGLHNQGKPVPVWVADAGDGWFGPGDWLEFVGQHLPGEVAYANEFSAHNIYVLQTHTGQPVRMRPATMQSGPIRPEPIAVQRAALSSPTSPRSFRIQQHLEQDKLLMRFRPQGNTLQELWYWAKLTHIDQTPFQVRLDLDSNALDPGQPVSIRLKFRGWSQPHWKAHSPVADHLADHRVEIGLNGTTIGSGEWNGQEEYLLELEIPVHSLQPQHNMLSIQIPTRLAPRSFIQLASQDSTSVATQTDPIIDVSLLNWIEISAAHRPVLTAAQTQLRVPLTARSIQLKTVSKQQLVVYGQDGSRFDQVNLSGFPLAPDMPDTLHTLSVSAHNEGLDKAEGDEKIWYAVLNRQLKSPQAIVLDRPSSLTERTNQADYLMIVHPRLIEAIQPLAAFHRRRGLSVAVVDVNDIYDEFNHGILHPRAIRTFIKYAHSHWTAPTPRFVLLVGDASWDTKNSTAQDTNYPDWTYQPHHQTRFVKNSSMPYPDLVAHYDSNRHNNRNLIPTWNYNSYEGHAASDNWFVALDDTDFHPTLAIGRFPVTEPAQVTAIVEKTIRYAEQAEVGPWRRNILWITNEQQGFQVQTDQLVAGTNERGFDAAKIYPQPHEADNAHHQHRLRQALNEGQLLVHFLGHGGRYIWRTGPPDFRKNHDLFTLKDLDELTPSNRLPVVVSMTCYSAPFDHPTADSIGEKFLRLADRGAVAVFAASWRNSPTSTFSDSVMGELIRPGTIGESILRAKQREYNQLLVETYNLLGDPALPLALPQLAVDLQLAAEHEGLTLTAAIDTTQFQGQAQIEWLNHEGQIVHSQQQAIHKPQFEIVYPGLQHHDIQTVRVYVWERETGRDGIGGQAISARPRL